MAKLIGQETVDGVTERWLYDETSDTIHVDRSQDIQDAIELMAAINAAGEAPYVEGLGKAVAEVPVVLAMRWAAMRGIQWEAFMYSNEYDSEWKRMFAAMKKLTYENHGRQQAAH